jgi:hypothetical protein
MASGGHRGNAGRPLDPTSLAASKRSGVDGFLMLEDPTGDPPECPLPSASERELFWWDRLWRRPQASQWLALRLEDEVALYCRYIVEAEQPEAPSATRTLVKQYQELLGLSTAGLKRLMWSMPDGVVTAKAPAPRRKSSSRARLKVVGNDG